MTVTDERPSNPDGPAVDGGPPSEMLYGAGQAAWLAVVTVVAFLGLALGVIALVVADGGGGGETASDGATPTEPSDQASVTATDFAFDPSQIPLFAGEEVTVDLANEGGVAHNLTVLAAGEEITSEDQFTEDMVLAATDDVNAGEDGSVAFTLDAGDYQVICTIPGHFAAGMSGTITASEAGGAA